MVTGDRVHLRSGPGLSYEILLTFHLRDKVEVVERRGDWFGVHLPEGSSLYVHRSLVETGEGEGWIRGDRVQVRSGPGVTRTRMGFLSKGERVLIRGVENDWVRIVPPASFLGWVREDYVIFLQPLEEKTPGAS